MMFKILKVSKYKVDGREFDTELDARKYAIEQEVLGKLRTLLKVAIDSSLTRQGNVDNVLKNIIGEAAEVSNILLTYRKKQPKSEAKAA
jgi:hypothetical protein